MLTNIKNGVFELKDSFKESAELVRNISIACKDNFVELGDSIKNINEEIRKKRFEKRNLEKLREEIENRKKNRG